MFFPITLQGWSKQKKEKDVNHVFQVKKLSRARREGVSHQTKPEAPFSNFQTAASPRISDVNSYTCAATYSQRMGARGLGGNGSIC